MEKKQIKMRFVLLDMIPTNKIILILAPVIKSQQGSAPRCMLVASKTYESQAFGTSYRSCLYTSFRPAVPPLLSIIRTIKYHNSRCPL